MFNALMFPPGCFGIAIVKHENGRVKVWSFSVLSPTGVAMITINGISFGQDFASENEVSVELSKDIGGNKVDVVPL